MKAFSLTMSAGLSLAVSACVIACSGASMQRKPKIQPVGLWEEESPTVHSITLRKADGTYRTKEIQVYDYAKPAVKYECAGHWKVSAGKYISDVDYVSIPMWKTEVGKQWSQAIIEVKLPYFRYFSTDGAVVEERRIAGPSDAKFKDASLKPIFPGE